MGKVTFKYENNPDKVESFEIEDGDTILDVALDNEVHLSHNCGAVCACSTCHIYVEKGNDFLPEMSEAEEDFVDRARNPKFNSRLACQCKLEQDGDIEVIIPDQSQIIGH
jgi:2Fe-2S ferredoxin